MAEACRQPNGAVRHGVDRDATPLYDKEAAPSPRTMDHPRIAALLERLGLPDPRRGRATAE